jgi:hypothetical protein
LIIIIKLDNSNLEDRKGLNLGVSFSFDRIFRIILLLCQLLEEANRNQSACG